MTRVVVTGRRMRRSARFAHRARRARRGGCGCFPPEQGVECSGCARALPVLLVVLRGVIHVLASGFEARGLERWVVKDRANPEA